MHGSLRLLAKAKNLYIAKQTILRRFALLPYISFDLWWYRIRSFGRQIAAALEKFLPPLGSLILLISYTFFVSFVAFLVVGIVLPLAITIIILCFWGVILNSLLEILFPQTRKKIVVRYILVASFFREKIFTPRLDQRKVVTLHRLDREMYQLFREITSDEIAAYPKEWEKLLVALKAQISCSLQSYNQTRDYLSILLFEINNYLALTRDYGGL